MNFGWDQILAEAQERAIASQKTSQCFCVGPQNGQPVCPCAMQSVKVIDGRYVRIIDLGPAPLTDEQRHEAVSQILKGE